MGQYTKCSRTTGFVWCWSQFSCMSDKVFHQLPTHHCSTKWPRNPTPKFKSAGRQLLPVRGQYEFRIRIRTNFIVHKFYVITDTKPPILGIDFIQEHQLWYCAKKSSFAWEGQPNWGMGHVKACSATSIPLLSVAYLKASIQTSLPLEWNHCFHPCWHWENSMENEGLMTLGKFYGEWRTDDSLLMTSLTKTTKLFQT